jgi:hypothetical protein
MHIANAEIVVANKGTDVALRYFRVGRAFRKPRKRQASLFEDNFASAEPWIKHSVHALIVSLIIRGEFINEPRCGE